MHSPFVALFAVLSSLLEESLVELATSAALELVDGAKLLVVSIFVAFLETSTDAPADASESRGLGGAEGGQGGHRCKCCYCSAAHVLFSECLMPSKWLRRLFKQIAEPTTGWPTTFN